MRPDRCVESVVCQSSPRRIEVAAVRQFRRDPAGWSSPSRDRSPVRGFQHVLQSRGRTSSRMCNMHTCLAVAHAVIFLSITSSLTPLAPRRNCSCITVDALLPYQGYIALSSTVGSLVAVVDAVSLCVDPRRSYAIR